MKKILAAVVLSMSYATVASADDVEAVWKAQCKSCHGETGKGDTKAGKKEKVRDMTKPEFQTKWSDADLKKVIVDGSKDNKKMKAFKEKLSEAEIDALVKHIRTFKT